MPKIKAIRNPINNKSNIKYLSIVRSNDQPSWGIRYGSHIVQSYIIRGRRGIRVCLKKLK